MMNFGQALGEVVSKASILGGILALVLTSPVPSAAAERAAVLPAPLRAKPPGEGVICVFAIYSVAAEVGKTCFPNDDKQFQAALRSSVQKIEAYVVANSGWSAAEVAKFKQSQGGVGAPKDRLCSPDPVMIYRSTQRAGAEKLWQGLEGMLSKPGKPTWGTCF